ncbi:sporulation protein [Flavobacterium cyanobacteriorum]|uniref:Sporulation protein n=1 Tax=Flavobacterium cyanobacteriorum TaxID=2022802 RepID=A0A256A073_9FLAO|nr:SPOR domain-containing protein [Flavobacterium cyanobacteriorum]OYQ47158.1 sporulation protein [Flavobacterium cyanobacteriorum]
MKIEKYISALLYRYQCVTLPGFGAFLTEIQPAQINADTSTFYPPKKLISFNANVKNNDGLLANHIALQEKISYDQAVAAIGSEVEKWLYRLERKEALTLKNLGHISTNSEGNLVFTPDTPVNYLTDAFGLNIIISPVVKREELKKQAEALEEKAPVLFTHERRKSYAYLKYAAIIIVALSAGATGYKLYNDNRVAEETLLVEKAVQEKIQEKIQTATFFIDNPLPAVALTVAEEENLNYHIVAGAFRSRANAGKAMRQLQNKGFKGRMLGKNQFGLYPVLYGSFATRAEAQDSMMQIREKHDKQAWLLVKEL